MNPDLQEVETIIDNAIDALKIGDSVNVTRLARHAASIAPGSEVAWLLLATVASPQDSLAFIQKALEINPENEAAQEALIWAQGRLTRQPTEENPLVAETAQPSGAESTVAVDAPQLTQETQSTADDSSSELQEAAQPPADEPSGLDENFTSLTLQTTELQEAGETPSDEPSGMEEDLNSPAAQSTELQGAGETPADEQAGMQEDLNSPAVQSAEFQEAPLDEPAGSEKIDPLTEMRSTELEAAPGIPADVPEFLKDTSPLPARETESRPSTAKTPTTPRQPLKTKWTFPESAAAPGRVHSPLRATSLINSRASTMKRRKKGLFSTFLIFLASALVVVVLAGVFSFIFLRPQLTSMWEGFFPVEGCRASLVIGEQSYQVWPLKPGADGNYDVPTNQPGRAYYAQTTSNNFVFFLSPVSENQTFMSGLQTGEPGSVTWSNCNTSTYRLNQPVAQILDMPVLLDQTVGGMTILLPWQGSTSGFVLKGSPENFLLPVIITPNATNEIIQPEATAAETPMPIGVTGLTDFQVEIALLETIPSAELSSIQVGISIHNFGEQAGRLTVNDVGLTPQGGTALGVLQSDPALPLELAPGSTQTIYLTFPRPATATARLSILSIEFDLEGY